ncbi:MAG: Ig-like domain-containing protein [Fusobacteria bacterium]|nr:Ig-like domain-containing protein [Fusobacteriota bacterium]
MKKIVIVVIVMVIAIGLFGCSSAGSGNTPSTPTKLSISLSENSTTLAASGTLKLTATESTGTVPIVWSSQNDSVATVNQEGVIVANGPGTTNIVATILGTNVTATCSVVVTGVAQITISQNDIGAFVSATPVQLTETTVKTGIVSWTTDNAAVATVDSTGLVSFGASGTAIITATQTLTGATATCAVTVTQPALSITPPTLTGYTSSPAFPLKVTIEQPGTVTWSSDNLNVATVDANGMVSFGASGTATITAIQAGTNAKATCAVTVTLSTLSLSPTSLYGFITAPITKTKLTLTKNNPAKVTWSSNSPLVAAVDANGNVAFVGMGTATITAIQAGTNLKATCAVSVTGPS